MNKLSLIMSNFLIIIILTGSTIPTFHVFADPYIIVVPTEHNFGDVELGTSVTAIITASNLDGHVLIISDITLQSGSSPDFSVTAPSLPAVISPGDTTFIEILFSPSSEGDHLAILEIENNDLSNPIISVLLSGSGVQQGVPPVSVADILAFFDASVADGTLSGAGPGKSAKGRLNALRNRIEAAGGLLDAGLSEEACKKLMNAYKHCDGELRPPDFITGPAASTLASMILDLIESLSC